MLYLVGDSYLNKFDPIKGIETFDDYIIETSTAWYLNKFDPIKGIETWDDIIVSPIAR